MDKKLEQIGQHEIRHMSQQECEETLLYLRYYLNRLSPGTQKETYQRLAKQLQARLQASGGRKDAPKDF